MTGTVRERPGADPVEEPKTTAGMAPARRQQFEADLAEIRVRTGSSANEPRMVALGLGLMAVGAVVALVGFLASGGIADTRDVLSVLILSVFGLCLSVAGAALFLRYSLSRFLRVWLLRLIYEQQPSVD